MHMPQYKETVFEKQLRLSVGCYKAERSEVKGFAAKMNLKFNNTYFRSPVQGTAVLGSIIANGHG